MERWYTADGKSFGQVIGSAADGKGGVLLVLRAIDGTITTAPAAICKQVAVCSLCHAAPAQIDPQTKAVISQLCDAHQKAQAAIQSAHAAAHMEAVREAAALAALAALESEQ